MLVPSMIRESVVFLGIRDGDQFLPRATAFVISYEENGYHFFALATAEHVVSGLLNKGHDIYVRMNREGGTVVRGPINASVWFFHPNADAEPTDVAVVPYQPQGDEIFRSVPVFGQNEMVCTTDVISAHSIGPGDELAIIGLFRTHHGVDRIIPVVRKGHIAAMREEPIKTQYCGYVDAYLIEAMSIGGLSGSPVFVQMPPIRIAESKVNFIQGSQFYLLGLMHGHFDVANLNEDVVSDVEGQSLASINAGLGIVIPAEKIVETIFHPEYIEMRKRAIEEHQKDGAKPDIAADSERRPSMR